ncbi:MAG: 1-acyl-sn-glycerol-3-phosphate acyltransferase [Bacteroidetes bacterium HGW-Bacteroidetes-12]|nr:MAG: 1-acyl-sn-glycerol-3-phosphate acyltransferase [Bacteroidetes bacterium HGW-Bacteroidetes-12]
MLSMLRITLMIIWTFSLMLFAPLFIPFTLNRQFPLMVARTVFGPVLMRIAGVKLTVKGKENVPQNEPVIFIANHCSHLDIGVLCGSLPVNLHFLGKKELMWTPVVGWYMFVAGHIFVDRSNRKKAIVSIAKAADKISKGKSLMIFPEGTRSKSGKIGVFKKGAFHLALQANVKIIPVTINGTYKVWKPDSSQINPGKVTVFIGKPIDQTQYSKENISAFVNEGVNRILENLKE